MGFLSFIKHPLARSIKDLDGVDTYRVHRDIILSKPFLLEIYRRFYNLLFEPFKNQGLENLKIVEIGAGGFNSNYFYPQIITTDLHQTPFIKKVEDAHSLSFEDTSLDGIVFIDVLHHLPDPKLFFNEASRCLKSGGKIVLIEPYYGPWASLIYKTLHHEPWSDCEAWEIPLESTGRLSVANMKMPHNIFIRDIDIFKRTFPDLKVNEIKKINFFSYLLSGGLSYRSLVPCFMAKFIFYIERLLTPLSSIFAMHMVIEIEKT